MSTFKSSAHPMPCVNLNGNSKDSLLEQAYSVIDSYEDVLKAVSRCDLFHGRNGADADHRRALSERSAEIIQHLHRMKEYFTDIANWIDSDQRF